MADGANGPTDGYPTGAPRWILRAEATAVALAAILAYHQLGGTLSLFLLTILLPDVAMLGYLAGPRVGAVLYNVAHSYVLPAVLGFVGWLAGLPILLLLAAVWVAHVGVDRMLGYGLKYPSGFAHTHLGPIGRRRDG